MIYQLYSVYDEVLQVFNLPFASINHRDAMRSLTSAALDPESRLAQHPKDYSLYFVATYDDSNGSYSNIQPPSLLVRVPILIIQHQQNDLNELKSEFTNQHGENNNV
ncbi:MAG: nonstructural protein [Microvirus sp.]|nr:MAG: nonstructural protein [Microvirus sp.]WNK14412.1 MAG: nonstructural protein [Microvirus sp.]